MTDQLTNVQMTPMVKVVPPSGDERTFAFSEIALTGDDPATISDADLKARVARYLDLPANTFDGMVVNRPNTGNVLIAPKPTYGGRN